jgi:hypothetical protein
VGQEGAAGRAEVVGGRRLGEDGGEDRHWFGWVELQLVPVLTEPNMATARTLGSAW